MANYLANNILGTRFNYGYEEPFSIDQSDRRQHLYLIGKTGTGKSTLLRNLIVADLEQGRGFSLLDPHGDLAEQIIELIPRNRRADVVYFDPADGDYPIGFNPIESPHLKGDPLVASGIVGAFKNVWHESWGPRLEYILYASVAALGYCANVSLLGLPRMLIEKRYRQWVIKQVQDPLLKAFWLHEFENYEPRFRQEAISPIQNKVGQLFLSPLIRNVLGQVKSSLDVDFIMNNNKILIANLSKGRLGEDKSQLLGAMMVTAFQLGAMRRAALPEMERADFNLYVDEFHNFATDSFATILSEARKYRLCLTLSHQYTGQLSRELQDAVFGNVGSMIAFRVGHDDANELAKAFGAEYPPERFTDLANFEIMAKLLEAGTESMFFGRTAAPDGVVAGLGQDIRIQSQNRFGTPREVVERKIQRWLEW